MSNAIGWHPPQTSTAQHTHAHARRATHTRRNRRLAFAWPCTVATVVPCRVGVVGGERAAAAGVCLFCVLESSPDERSHTPLVCSYYALIRDRIGALERRALLTEQAAADAAAAEEGREDEGAWMQAVPRGRRIVLAQATFKERHRRMIVEACPAVRMWHVSVGEATRLARLKSRACTAMRRPPRHASPANETACPSDEFGRAEHSPFCCSHSCHLVAFGNCDYFLGASASPTVPLPVHCQPPVQTQLGCPHPS